MNLCLVIIETVLLLSEPINFYDIIGITSSLSTFIYNLYYGQHY